jgi:hypothetical protein
MRIAIALLECRGERREAAGLVRAKHQSSKMLWPDNRLVN